MRRMFIPAAQRPSRRTEPSLLLSGGRTAAAPVPPRVPRHSQAGLFPAAPRPASQTGKYPALGEPGAEGLRRRLRSGFTRGAGGRRVWFLRRSRATAAASCALPGTRTPSASAEQELPQGRRGRAAAAAAPGRAASGRNKAGSGLTAEGSPQPSRTGCGRRRCGIVLPARTAAEPGGSGSSSSGSRPGPSERRFRGAALSKR